MDLLGTLPAEVKGLTTKVSAVESRLTTVESRLTTVESQIVQLRTDMNDGFSATLQVIEASSKATQMMFDETQKIVRDGNDETRQEMRVLHEALVTKIAVLGEARTRQRKRKPDAPQ